MEVDFRLHQFAECYQIIENLLLLPKFVKLVRFVSIQRKNSIDYSLQI